MSIANNVEYIIPTIINPTFYVIEEQPPAFKYNCKKPTPSERNIWLAHRMLYELTKLGISTKQIAKQSRITLLTINNLLEYKQKKIYSHTFQRIFNFYVIFHYATLCHDEKDIENLTRALF